jgi:hypothetical protein
MTVVTEAEPQEGLYGFVLCHLTDNKYKGVIIKNDSLEAAGIECNNTFKDYKIVSIPCHIVNTPTLNLYKKVVDRMIKENN